MTFPTAPASEPLRPIRRLRWWIGGLLFASTVINYIDRQTLAALAPFLKEDYHWTNADYAKIVIAFRIAYAIGQTTFGRWIDRVGTREGLSRTVACYSLVSIATATIALFSSPWAVFAGFLGFRFLLGLAESPNWPGATKAVAEWFPRKERGWAVALFDSGSSIGAAIAPIMLVSVYLALGRRWWPAFILTGCLGALWLLAWRRLYHSPETHPRISAEEKELILADRAASGDPPDAAELPRPKWRELLRLPQTWGIIGARALTDPVWFFIADWFMLFLVQEKSFDPKNTLVAIWIPFVAADLGNFSGGGISSWLIARGWSVEWARKALVIFGALGMTMLIPAIYATNLFAIAALFGFATFAYTCFCTMALVLPSDLFRSNSVASVSGMSGTAAGAVTIGATYLIGDITTRYSFTPVLVAGSIIPLIGATLVLWLIRNPRTDTERAILRRI
ncbi:MAG: MFS transporter [Opitutaceae bacterium]|nr:MFS transporter [Opitutaceae bacterium]